MLLTAIRFPFRKNAARRRFGRLSRLLESLQSKISRESSDLRSSADRMTDCAAFAFEAMESGDCISPKIDKLTHNLADNRRRMASLERQEVFVAGMRSWLEAFLTRQR